MLRRVVIRKAVNTRSASSSTKPVTLGLRREDPARIWERRCPLTPDAVHELVHQHHVRVLVQECERRVFGMDEFVRAGAHPHPTLAPADIILGIKETPLPELDVLTSALDGRPRTHLMFSHTTKGQAYNMGLLSRFVQGHPGHEHHGLPPRLIDYELLTDDSGKRTVGFGWFAGVAGALESLSALAQAHLELGVASPFLHTPRPYTHPGLPSLRASLRAIGARIAEVGTPRSMGPFVIGVTGNGQVAQGCLDILQELPLEYVDVKNLPALVSDPSTDLHKIYLVHAQPSSYLAHTSPGAAYSRSEYYATPANYRSEFHTRVAPYLTLFLNGVGWEPGYPRLMTNEQLVEALEIAERVGKGRFGCVGDISCDIEGGLEFLTHPSTLSNPFYTIRPIAGHAHRTVQMMAVDILPTSVPLDASAHFSEKVLPYVRRLVGEYGGEKRGEEGGVGEALERATVAWDGRLVGRHAWLDEKVQRWRATAADGTMPLPSTHSDVDVPRALKRKKVLMLGSGMVAGPAVDELCRSGEVELVVASNLIHEAERLTRHHTNATALAVDMGDRERVGRLVQEADVVISLLPVPFHPAVAELCIQHGTHLVTASYISPAMRALHDKAVAADVLLLNEIGLDPGIDHCSAIKLFDAIHARGQRVTSFVSFCGGLPAPESAEDVPLGYKFSWSPRGVLAAALNGARFKLDHKVCEIPESEVLTRHFPDVPVSKTLRLEGIANRDSLSYADVYPLGGLQELRTLLRGTLRYPGYADLLQSFKDIGLLNVDKPLVLEHWTSLARQALESKLGRPIRENDPASMTSAIADVVPAHRLQAALEALDWFSLTPSRADPPASISVHNSDAGALPAVPQAPTAPLDLFAGLLAHKLRYEPGERDLVVLAHEVCARDAGGREEVYTSTLTAYGAHGVSAMSQTVGMPVAFAALEVLRGGVGLRGVQGPTERSVYDAVLEGLENAGLGMRESVRRKEGRSVEGALIESFQ